MVTGSNSYLISDESLNREHAADYHLSLLVDRDAFSWAVIQRSEKFVLEVGEHPFDDQSSHDQLNDLLANWALTKWSFGSLSLAVRGIPSTLVPKGLFDQEKKEAIMKLSSLEKPDQLESRPFNELEAVMVTNFPSAVLETVKKFFPDIQVYPNLWLNLSSVMTRNRFERPLQLYIDLSDSFMEVIIAGHKQLLLCNYFAVSAPEDALYHVSNNLKELGVDPSEVQLYLAGNIELTGDAYKLFKTYFPKLQMNFGFEMPKVASGLSALRKQRFLSLLNQFPCVS